jgi:hypothetical protein
VIVTVVGSPMTSATVSTMSCGSPSSGLPSISRALGSASSSAVRVHDASSGTGPLTRNDISDGAGVIVGNG